MKIRKFNVDIDSDGCSCWFDAWWRELCEAHDEAHYYGGSLLAKLWSDVLLGWGVVVCSFKTRNPIKIIVGLLVALPMTLMVMITAQPRMHWLTKLLPTTDFTWSYGAVAAGVLSSHQFTTHPATALTEQG